MIRPRLSALLGLVTFAAVACGATTPPPKADLPEGMELIVAAAPPLVKHPIMGCLDDRGRLFVGDSAGVNWRPAQLEKELPHRVLMLEDTDGDQVYDKVTVFADKMTFPQGACWVDGSLYVASPPGIWKLTDTNGDGVADQRTMIVSGFEYDGNAADVHGPFLHPLNGRLYWCHGRKGHKVVQQDGTLVHEGKASGVWSCRTDGSDVQWHALGCMDNPVEVDFTPEGDLFGVVNLYYNQPRGDTLIHWQLGGAYERPDQIAAIAALPRTLDTMPVVHNYGHVAVSGCSFYRSGALNPAWRGDMFVTFFNTQKLVRTKLVPAGATFTATTHEFLKIHDPNVHLTDVIEDADGSLLVLDTGGWFRIGCPASMIEKPDLRGAIYRVRKKDAPRLADPYGREIAWDQLTPAATQALTNDARWKVSTRAAALVAKAAPAVGANAALLGASTPPPARRRALETIAAAKRIDASQRRALLAMLGEALDPALEHAAMFAALATRCFDLETVRAASVPAAIRRLLRIVEQTSADDATQRALLEIARTHVGSPDASLAAAAAAVVARNPRALDVLAADLTAQLAAPTVAPATLALLAELTGSHLAEPPAQALITSLLRHPAQAARQTAWRVLARQSGPLRTTAWIAPLTESLRQIAAAKEQADLPLLLDAIARVPSPDFDQPLLALVRDEQRAQPIRLKALGASFRAGQPMGADAFALLLAVSRSDASPSARTEAARLLSRSKLSVAQQVELAPVVATTGPVELAELLKIARRADPATGRIWAEALARSPVFGAIEESAVRSAFSGMPAELYEQILMPAVRAATEEKDAKKRLLETLTTKSGQGRVAAGQAVFATSTCVACHKAGELGRVLGPDLSRIGQIRSARDLLESILFPSATIARDFETHIVETADRQTHTGTVKRETAAALVLVDPAGEEKPIPHPQIVAQSLSPTSLMPPGLERTMTEQQLLDLVAWLGSLK
ncbi:PVC-type heme-binding CxxCH protein [Horticoccus sp. 23ND18S-11]|uniref:PVC-type heme-binding CxxCH protein n=1 Tax=Horticoccus sp. 23ND18S-11 TaxID=3391832 RepID=UPI0039C8D92F